ncbi:hypothetical protein BD414DRAFT_485422 [Trametes punicea]|nr:hypothetical protein BD414DRAFT_485422 [Trametes punicea]
MAPTALSPASSNKRKRLSDNELTEGSKKLAKASRPCSKPDLRIITDIKVTKLDSPSLDQLLSAADSDTDSLFDEPPPQLFTPDIDDFHAILAPKIVDESLSELEEPHIVVAKRIAPPIPGLYFDPSILLPEALADDLMWTCIRTFFREGTVNQVMLFERGPSSSPSPASSTSSGLPACLTDLISLLADLLRPAVPPATHELLFSPSPSSHRGPPRARQAILNLYWPGEGISPHVDLLDRYGDGIIGVSLGSGCAMQFARSSEDSDASAEAKGECALYLPKGSVLVITEEARYRWTHGIEKRFDDLVEDFPGSAQNVRLERDVRLSITFRWLLPGADVVGSAPSSEDSFHEQ